MSKAVGESEVELRKWAIQQAIAAVEVIGEYQGSVIENAKEIYTWVTTGKTPK